MKGLVVSLCLFAVALNALGITVETPDGGVYLVDVEEQESLSTILGDVEQRLNFPIDLQSLAVKADALSYQRDKKQYRNYDAPVSKEEKKDISFIITSLAYKSYYSLMKNQDSLNAAGERIEHIHPLRFLMCIFTDKELIEGMKEIYRYHGFPWKKLSSELRGNLKEEFSKNNLRDEHLLDFASNINSDSKPILKIIHRNNWNDFVVYLIKNG